MLNDTSLMQFGKHEGKCLIEVPGSYLLWFWNENLDKWNHEPELMTRNSRELMEYIEDNFDAIEHEAGKNGRYN